MLIYMSIAVFAASMLAFALYLLSRKFHPDGWSEFAWAAIVGQIAFAIIGQMAIA